MALIAKWSVNAPNNNAAPPDGAPEGWLASQVNDVYREGMASTAKWYRDTKGALVTGGAGNAYTVATNSNFQDYADVSTLVIRINRANTGSATLNVDGLGATTMRVNGRALVSGQLIADTIVAATYNSEEGAFDLRGVPDNAADLVGTVADDRLSSNVPRLNLGNVFTSGSAQTINSVLPAWRFIENDAATDTGVWDIEVRNGDFRLLSRSDALALGEVAISAQHNASNEITLLALAADSITANGSEVLTEGVINNLTSINVAGLAATDGIYVDDNGAAKRMAFQDMGIRVVNAGAGDQTFALNDANTLQTIGNTNRTFTIPPNSSVAFNIGTCIYLASTGSGAITVDPGAGVTLNSVIAQGSTANRTVLAGGTAVLIKVGTNAWNLVGDIN